MKDKLRLNKNDILSPSVKKPSDFRKVYGVIHFGIPGTVKRVFIKTACAREVPQKNATHNWARVTCKQCRTKKHI